MSKRLRVVSYIVQPQFMVDDGETLVPLAVHPITVSAAEWPHVVELVSAAIGQLRREIEDAPNDDP